MPTDPPRTRLPPDPAGGPRRDPEGALPPDPAGGPRRDPEGGLRPDPAGPALAEALVAVGDRWALLLVATLLDGPLRFGELQERLSGIAPNVLSQRLRHLQEHGLIAAEPYSERPPRFVYELTAPGHELADPLRLLADWGARHGESDPPRHATCGSALEVVWYCPTCSEAVFTSDPEQEETHFA
jgi:DNA-binding HxlR family transcriptional regulator